MVKLKANESSPFLARRWGARAENWLKIAVILLFIALVISAGFLIYKYILSFSEPPRTYFDLQLRIWQSAVEKEPKNPTAHTNLGYIYVKMNKRRQALEEFKKALEIDPQNVGALYSLGNLYYLLKNRDEAIENIAAAAQYAPDGDKYAAYFRLGEIYEATKKYDLALDAYQKSVADNSTMWNSHFKLGRLLEKAGKNDLALEHYKRAAALNPTNVELQRAIQRLSPP